MLKGIQNLDTLFFHITFVVWKRNKHQFKNKKFTIMGKEIIVKHKMIEDYKLILKVEIDEEDEDLLKKEFNLSALKQKLSEEQSEVLENVFGHYWYKLCEINILK